MYCLIKQTENNDGKMVLAGYKRNFIMGFGQLFGETGLGKGHALPGVFF